MSKKISDDLQLKFKKVHEEPECNSSKNVLNFDKVSPVTCGLGCQLHTISAGFLCATDMKKKYFVVNHLGKYEEYFSNFKLVCGKHDQIIGI